MKDTFGDPAPLASPARPSLSARLARFLGLLAALCALSAGVMVTQRLSEESLALLLGLGCGVAAMVPTLALLFLSWRREVVRRVPSPPQSAQGAPPIIVVSPPAALPYGAQHGQQAYVHRAGLGWDEPRAARTFEIIGDGE